MLRDVVIDIIDIDFSNPFERSCYSILILCKGITSCTFSLVAIIDRWTCLYF